MGKELAMESCLGKMEKNLPESFKKIYKPVKANINFPLVTTISPDGIKDFDMERPHTSIPIKERLVFSEISYKTLCHKFFIEKFLDRNRNICITPY